MSAMGTCATTKQVIEALGGIAAVAALTGRTYNAACNWGGFDTFPANTYVAMTAALSERGLTAPPSLWGMVEPERESAA